MIVTKQSLDITKETKERVEAPYQFYKLGENILVGFDERQSAYQHLKKRNSHLEEKDFTRILHQYILDHNRGFIGLKNTSRMIKRSPKITL